MKNIIILLGFSLMLTGCSINNLGQTQNNTNENISDEAPNIAEGLYYIKNISVKNDKISIEIDEVEWLDVANNTCNTPPEVQTGIPQCNPNGFLIQNSSPDIKTYEVSPSADILTTKFGANPSADTEISLQEFQGSFTLRKEYFETVPFIIQTESNIVMAIQEKYIP